MLWTKGVETGRLTPNEFVAVTSTNIAQILNIYPQKGAILPGSDADIVVWDPKLSKTISAANQKSIIDYNVFEGFKVNGQAAPHAVARRGGVVLRQERPAAARPRQAAQAEAVPGGQHGAVEVEGTDRAARRHPLGRAHADRRVRRFTGPARRRAGLPCSQLHCPSSPAKAGVACASGSCGRCVRSDSQSVRHRDRRCDALGPRFRGDARERMRRTLDAKFAPVRYNSRPTLSASAIPHSRAITPSISPASTPPP